MQSLIEAPVLPQDSLWREVEILNKLLSVCNDYCSISSSIMEWHQCVPLCNTVFTFDNLTLLVWFLHSFLTMPLLRRHREGKEREMKKSPSHIKTNSDVMSLNHQSH